MLRLSDARPYQDRAIDQCYESDALILRIKMGGGKTMIMATAFQELVEDEVLERVLIFAPPRVAKKVWPDEIEEWEHLRNDWFGFAVGDADQRMATIENMDHRIVLVSFNNIPWFFETYGKTHGFDGLGIDELSKLKDNSGKWFKTLSRRLKDFKVRIGGTGTFISEGIQDAYAQAFLIDRGAALGKTWTGFRNTCFEYVGPNHWDWTPRDDGEEIVTEALAPITFQIDGSEYEDQLPPLVPIDVKVDMPPRSWEIYNDMAQTGVWEEIEAVNAGVQTGKLQQIADGFIYHEGADTWDWLHNAKLDALEELLQQAEDPVLVAYYFQAELDQMLKRWPRTPYLGEGVSDKKANAAIDAWNDRALPFMFIHPQSAGHGLNLQKGGDTIVWYGFTWSLDDYDQLNARLRRSGQESDTVFVHRIMVEGTIDESIAMALQDKRDVQEAVYEGLRKHAA